MIYREEILKELAVAMSQRKDLERKRDEYPYFKPKELSIALGKSTRQIKKIQARLKTAPIKMGVL